MSQNTTSRLRHLPLLALLLAGGLPGADLYLLPVAAGSGDGSSWANARATTRESFQAAWDAAVPGDTLHLGSGSYGGLGIRASHGGEPGRRIALVGEDRGGGLPVFSSDFDKHHGGATFFAAREGVSHVEIRGFVLKAYQRGVFIRGQGEDFRLSGLRIEGALEGIRSDGGATVDDAAIATHDVVVSDCRFEHFVKRAIRLQGGNYRWRIERCHADAGGKEWGVAAFPICYQLSARPNRTAGAPAAPDAADKDPFSIRPMSEIHAMEHDLELIDCVAENCYFEGTAAKGDRYWNGDGFCGERGAKDIRFVRCIAMHNTDGGWDLKCDGLEFIDCVAIDNKDNFRLWSGMPRLTNCLSAFAFKRGGSGPTSGLWTKTGVELERCTFIANPVVIEQPGAVVAFRNSIFVGARPRDPAAVTFADSFVGDQAAAGIAARAGMAWDGPSTMFDSTLLPESQGFSSKRWSR